MKRSVAIIGAGPAGLMAAEQLSAGGVSVTVFDRMPSVGRKLLMAGRGGLNLTHSEPFGAFITRYGKAAPRLRPILEAFPPAALIGWANGLGQETFIGSSGRIFPKAMKASPLLRAWLARLDRQGVRFRLRHEWRGEFEAEVMVLAMGGATWPRLGSDGSWIDVLAGKGVKIAPLKPSNVGFTTVWSDPFRGRFAGHPLKNIALVFGDHRSRGDAMITRYGIEGGAIYAMSSILRNAIETSGPVSVEIDLRPDQTEDQIAHRLARPRNKDSRSNFLRKALNLSPLEINLLRETAAGDQVKSLRLVLTAVQPLTRAISTAGGISFDAVDEDLMLKVLPNVYVAGEMLDWEAPTGGYLLQACFAMGAFAGRAILSKIRS